MSSPKKIDLKCPVCEEVRQAFICVKCICNGDYTRSTMFCGHRCTADTAVAYDAKDDTIIRWTMKDRENFSELMETEQTRINERFEELLTKYKELEEIESCIAEYEFKISNIKNLIKLRQSEAKLAEERTNSMIKNKGMVRTGIELLSDNNKDIHKSIDRSNSRLESHYTESNKIEAEIKKMNRENLLKLKEQIFPFDCRDDNDPNPNDHTCEPLPNSLLSSRPSISGSCKSSHVCCIVNSWLPKDSGAFEYSNFIALCKQREKLNEDLNLHLEDDCSIRENPAYRVSSALANISQLISVASSLLDLRLPKKQKFMDWFITSQFDGFEVFPSNEEIFHKAAKLNANLMYLCLSQNVSTDLLDPAVTGNNLKLLFDPENSDLGRTGPVLIPQELHLNIEDTLLPDFQLFDAKDYEDIEFFDEELSDWEAIPRSSVFDSFQDNQTTINSESILTNLAETCYNAVTSFIRR